MDKRLKPGGAAISGECLPNICQLVILKDTYPDPIFFLNGGIRYIPAGRIMPYNKSFVASILSFKVAVSKARADRQPEICP